MPNVRMDEWTACADAPTAVPRELKPKGFVSRGMNDLQKAKEYADQVAIFFAQNGATNKEVFVVAGPTSTTKAKFEVVEATAGYSVLYKTGAPAPDVTVAQSESEPEHDECDTYAPR